MAQNERMKMQGGKLSMACEEGAMGRGGKKKEREVRHTAQDAKAKTKKFRNKKRGKRET